MQAILLTPLGDLTRRSLENLEEEYEENAAAKRKKLEGLWPAKEDLARFEAYYCTGDSTHIIDDGKGVMLEHAGTARPLTHDEQATIDRFVALGLVDKKTVAARQQAALIEQTLRRKNPIQHLEKVFVELTGACNLSCKHCYRGGSRPGEAGLAIDEIKQALTPLLRAGIKEVVITGGEPTLRRKDLVELVTFLDTHLLLTPAPSAERMLAKYGTATPTVDDVLGTPPLQELREKLYRQLSLPPESVRVWGSLNITNENTSEDVERVVRNVAAQYLEYDLDGSLNPCDRISVLSNGTFDDPRALVRELYAHHAKLQTSLDSFDSQRTNENRGRKGLFGDVKRLVTIAREEGGVLYVQGLDLNGTTTPEEERNKRFFENHAEIRVDKAMLQLGNATKNGLQPNKRGNASIGDLSREKAVREGWCKGFTTPTDLHLRPNGNVGNCLYAYACPEEFGNVRERPLTEILNNLPRSNVSRMFSDGRIERYQHELDRKLFPQQFQTSCELIVITMTYGTFKERLEREGHPDPRREANLLVAREYKFL